MSSEHESALWGRFLDIRAQLIDAFHARGDTDVEIAAQISADAEQVRSIRVLRIRPWRDYNGSVYALPGGKTGFAPMPIDLVGKRVLIRFRDGSEIETNRPEQMRWGWTRPYVSGADIVGYRIIE